jgi:hypothetical protein
VAGRPVKLQQNVVADGVNERAELLGATDSILCSQRFQNPQESFLLNVLHGLGRAHTGAELDEQEFAEITDKMLLGPEVPIAKLLEVTLVEIEEIHAYLEQGVSISS